MDDVILLMLWGVWCREMFGHETVIPNGDMVGEFRAWYLALPEGSFDGAELAPHEAMMLREYWRQESS